MRRVFEALLGNQSLTDDCLRTLFCEAERAVNSRPLSVVSSDIGDLSILTPHKLLTLGEGHGGWSEPSSSETYSRRRWRQIQQMADHFWRKWCKEYRVALQERNKWKGKTRNLQEGDIVLIVDEAHARCHWPLGRVRRTYPSTDGLVRSVDVLLGGKLLRRPITKLVLILEEEDQP